ncbi:MAG TPA: hypothetical protein VIY73_14820 [Polyangiaceae bacterium]
MNVWKPIALCLAAGLVISVGIQSAHATNSPDPQPVAPNGPCFDQPHMAAAKGALENAVRELGSAEHNKGGWRVTAQQNAAAALAATNQGCSTANR